MQARSWQIATLVVDINIGQRSNSTTLPSFRINFISQSVVSLSEMTEKVVMRGPRGEIVKVQQRLQSFCRHYTRGHFWFRLNEDARSHSRELGISLKQFPKKAKESRCTFSLVILNLRLAQKMSISATVRSKVSPTEMGVVDVSERNTISSTIIFHLPVSQLVFNRDFPGSSLEISSRLDEFSRSRGEQGEAQLFYKCHTSTLRKIKYN